MTTILICAAIALVAGVVAFVIEKSDKINIHIDRHHDAFLAGLTGGTVGFFVSLVLVMLHIL